MLGTGSQRSFRVWFFNGIIDQGREVSKTALGKEGKREEADLGGRPSAGRRRVRPGRSRSPTNVLIRAGDNFFPLLLVFRFGQFSIHVLFQERIEFFAFRLRRRGGGRCIG